MLGNGGQMLVKKELEGEVICVHKERASPQVWAPMAHRLDEVYELAFVCRQLRMAWRNQAAEEGDGPSVLVQHCSEARRMHHTPLVLWSMHVAVP
jgi:hypothetical protein